MIRRYAPLAVLLVAVAVAGCTAGAPGSTKPTPTPAQVAAANLAAPQAAQPAPTPTPPPPLPTPTPTPAPVQPTTAPVDPVSNAARLPPPTPLPSGRSLVYIGDHGLSETDDDSTLPLQVAFTWDAGADTGYTSELLDILRDYGIKASFGMTGQWAENNPDLVRRIVDEGHMIFNHTWSHKSLTGENGGLPPMTYDELKDELDRTEAIVKDLTGYDMKPYFRPPYGDYKPFYDPNVDYLAWLADLGYTVNVMWTCDTRGWAGWSAEKIVGYCTTNIARNEIILLHVGANAITDLQSLPGQIDFFRSQGYAFVTIEEMIQPNNL